MRVLITGSRGQLGHILKRKVPETWELIATDHKTLDITNEQAVDNMISMFRPDTVINTAGYTNVEKAEIPEELNKVFAINATGVMHLAKSSKRLGARFIHVSSDYVFYGEEDGLYKEIDPPCGINRYGASKLSGELLALAHNPNTLIVRSSGLYSEIGNNFVLRVLNQAKEGKELVMTDDNSYCPTYAGDLANALIQITDGFPHLKGIVHYAGTDVRSSYAFAKEILEMAGLPLNLLKAGEPEGLIAKRPHNSALDSSTLKTAGFHIPSLQCSLRTCLDNLAKMEKQELAS